LGAPIRITLKTTTIGGFAAYQRSITGCQNAVIC